MAAEGLMASPALSVAPGGYTMQRTIIVTEYDPGWPAAFEALRARAAGVLGELAVAIEHVGSTSVPGLAAKPIIDIDVVVRSPDEIPAAIEALATIGYSHLGDLGIAGREAFRQPPGPPEHHLYVCPLGGRELPRHLAFRDYLRAHPEAADVYAALKRAAALRFSNDIDGYVAAKTEFIEGILSRAAPITGLRPRVG
jgi:GrpB-like predicted nucleotidyltransferase (UPF0157 family)